ncbi:HAD family hydrolase [Syntrophorhabdus aromaticivorans]|uniref:HAD family hydrolase n=1 Tax=Syntrophorhabdus aromaticivorans TaxID=328301 RepID=UPI000424A614|nr:HAD family phosphatase [Syntrophorhabdus aromaticivorans]
MIKLFVFDLGNVILPFEHRQIGAKLYERSRDRKNLTPQRVFDVLFDMEEGLINRYEEGLMSSSEFFEDLKSRFELDMDLEAFKDIWNPIFREDEDVKQAILYLKEKGYPLFLLSNTNELHFSYIMEKYPIVHVFDEWILSFEVGAKKPEERIFRTIFEKMDIRAEEVFYIDDIPPYVEAARALGIDGMIFRDAEQLWDAANSKAGATQARALRSS